MVKINGNDSHNVNDGDNNNEQRCITGTGNKTDPKG